MGKHDTYESSYLGYIGSELLKATALLKQKYPETETDSLEKKHALIQIKTIETVIKKLHHDVVPQFDRYKRPGLLGIIRNLYTIKDLDKEFSTRKYALYLSIIEKLAPIVKQAQEQSQNPTDIAHLIVSLLEKDKNNLFKNAMRIPGQSLDKLLDEVKEIILKTNADLSKKDCVATLQDVLSTTLFQQESDKLNLLIVHPMMFEFAELAIRLIENAPKELSELMPFLHPKAFEIDFHSGITGSFINTMLGFTITVTPTAPSNNQQQAHTYNVETFYNDNTKETKQIDGNYEYVSTMFNYRTLLMEQMQLYFSEYKDTPHAKRQVVLAQILRQFETKEAEFLTVAVETHLNACNRRPELNQLDSPFLITALSTEIELNELSLKNNLQLCNELAEKKESYSKSTIQQLLKLHPELEKSLESYPIEGITIDFSTMLLPELIINPTGTDNIRVLQVPKYLQQLISQQLEELKSNQKQLQETIQQQKIQRDEAVTTWQHNTIEEHAEKIKTMFFSLDELRKSFEQIHNANNESLSHAHDNDNDNDALEHALAKKKELYSALEQLHQKVNDHLDQIINASQLPHELALLDTNKVIQSTQVQQCQAAVENAQNLSTQIESVITKERKELHYLESQLEKAQSEALFIKSMQLADPEKMNFLLTELTTKISKAEVEQTQLKIELEELSSSNIKQQKLEVQLKQQTAVLKKQIEEINDLMHPIIESICSNAEHIRAPNIPTQEAIIENQKIFDRFSIALVIYMDNLLKNFQDEHCQDGKTLLSEVTSLLNQNSSIPFKKINALPILATMKKGSALPSFKFFLTFIGLQQQIASWEDYRSRQDDWFKFKPQKDEYIEQITTLRNAIKEKKEQLKSDEAQQLEMQGISDFRESLSQHTLTLSSKYTQKHTLKATLDLLDTQLKKNIMVNSELQHTLTDKQQALEHVVKRKELLQTDHLILTNILNIIAHINVYQQQIELFASQEYTSFTDISLYQKIAKLQKEYQQLINEKDQVVEIIEQSPNSRIYKNNIEALTQLFNSVHQKLTTNIKLKVDATPLREQIDISHAALIEISQNLALLTGQHDPEDIATLISRYSSLSSSIEKQEQIVQQFMEHTSLIDEEHTNQSQTQIESSKNKLRQNANNLGHLLMDKLISILEQFKIEARVFQDHAPNQEGTEMYLKTVSQLNSISNSLILLADNKDLDEINLPDLTEKKSTINLLKIEATKQLEQSQLINQRVSQRIQERTAVVDTILVPQLILNEKVERSIKKNHSVIVALHTELKKYKNTGDSNSLFALIDANKALYAHVYFRTIFSKLTAELIDLDEKIPKNYNSESLAPNHEVKQILQNHTKENPDYVAAINKLYVYVDNMAKKWSETTSLTIKLRENIDHFVINHPTKLPDEETYSKFKKHFTARLHSEDVVMNQHRSSWKNYLANFAIGFFTLGIALGIKLIHSKLNEGRYTLFFDKTQRQKQIDTMEQQVDSMDKIVHNDMPSPTN